MCQHRLLLIGPLLFCLILLAACTNDDKPPEQTSSQGKEKAAAEDLQSTDINNYSEKISGQRRSDSDLYVTITPQPATGNTDLVAIAGGNPTDTEFEWAVNGNTVEGEISNRLPADYFSRGDQVTVFMYSSRGTISKSTEIANSPPKVLSIDFVESRLHKGVDIELIAEVEDSDGDSVDMRYIWTLNGEEVIGRESNLLPGEMIQRSDLVSFTAIPNDGIEDGSAFKAKGFEIPNGAPRFISNYPLSFSNFEYSYTAIAEDPDGDELYYALEDGPEGMSINSTSGEIFWQISSDQGGDHTVRITAEDPEGLKASQEFTLTVSIR